MRNPIAKDLRTPKYKPRVEKNRKAYNRKEKHKDGNTVRSPEDNRGENG